MSAPTYTYSLTNGQTADASQVQQNFSDILNGVTDGTKDLSVSAFTAAGTAALNGAVTTGGMVTHTKFPRASGLVKAAAADYAILDTDGYGVVEVTTGSSTRTITLPAAANNTGRVLSIVKVDTGSGFVTIDGNGAETINGQATQTLCYQFGRAMLYCNGTTWYLTSPIYESASLALSSSSFANWGTGTVYYSQFNRKGAWMDGDFSYKFGTLGSVVVASLTIPSGLTIDHTALTATAYVASLGIWTVGASGGASNLFDSANAGVFTTDGSTTNKLFFAYSGASSAYSNANNNSGPFASNVLLAGQFRIPIVEWRAS